MHFSKRSAGPFWPFVADWMKVGRDRGLFLNEYADGEKFPKRPPTMERGQFTQVGKEPEEEYECGEKGRLTFTRREAATKGNPHGLQ